MPYTTDYHDFNAMVFESHSTPVRILAEGDSWFAYPRRFLAFGKASNIVQVLGKKKRYIIYSSSSNGDEAVTMMTGEQKLSFTKRLKHTEFDLVLFSGGGNDIVGQYDFDFFLRRRDHATDLHDCIDWDRLENKIQQIRSVYVEMVERVEQYSANPDARIVTHTYDYAIPQDKGFQLFDLIPVGDSWIHPYLWDKGYTDTGEQREVVRLMLGRFRDEMLKLEQEYPDRLFVADTQGLLKDNQWRNEIHPTPGGFKVVAKKVEEKMKEALAG